MFLLINSNLANLLSIKGFILASNMFFRPIQFYTDKKVMSISDARKPLKFCGRKMSGISGHVFLCASADSQRGTYNGSKCALLVANPHINSTLEISESTERHELLVHSERQYMMKCMHFGHEKCVPMNIEKSTSVKSKCYLLTIDNYRGGHLVKDDKFTHLSLPRVRSISYIPFTTLQTFSECMLHFLKTQVQRTHNLKNQTVFQRVLVSGNSSKFTLHA